MLKILFIIIVSIFILIGACQSFVYAQSERVHLDYSIDRVAILKHTAQQKMKENDYLKQRFTVVEMNADQKTRSLEDLKRREDLLLLETRGLEQRLRNLESGVPGDLGEHRVDQIARMTQEDLPRELSFKKSQQKFFQAQIAQLQDEIKKIEKSPKWKKPRSNKRKSSEPLSAKRQALHQQYLLLKKKIIKLTAEIDADKQLFYAQGIQPGGFANLKDGPSVIERLEKKRARLRDRLRQMDDQVKKEATLSSYYLLGEDELLDHIAQLKEDNEKLKEHIIALSDIKDLRVE